ncbi:MAG: hypothetical protein LBS61_03080 [Endomicrobium sp.]|jgi:hypothetical protein|nr:hypothetical protein [Endomicrobium sp.]
MLVNGVKDTEGSRREIIGMIEVNYFHDVGERFKIGARLSDGNTGKISFKNPLKIETNTRDVSGNYKISLKSVMFGGSYNKSIGVGGVN